jgi:tRNA pseudouridine55 synthase
MSADGLILVDKPSGMTSHDVVAKIRRALSPGKSFKQRIKCGHTGTLDPMATGLMLILCGRATRLSKYLTGLNKKYRAVVVFGIETDTLDADGKIIGKSDVNCNVQDLEIAIKLQHGEIAQVPPLYSAIKKDGKRYYDRVRSGEKVDSPDARIINIYSLKSSVDCWGAEPASDDLSASDGKQYQATFTTECSSGTYVRSIVRDVAMSIDTVAHLVELRRLKVSDFDVCGALSGDDISDPIALRKAMRPMREAVAWAPSIILTDDEVRLTRIGVQPAVGLVERIVYPEVKTSSKYPAIGAFDQDGNLISMMKHVNDELSLEIVIPEASGE